LLWIDISSKVRHNFHSKQTFYKENSPSLMDKVSL